MNKFGLIIISMGIALFSSRASAADKPSDTEIVQKLVGSWIVPPDSTDYSKQNAYSIETFKPDGTYTFYVFGDAACHVITQQIQAKWTIENGVLVSTLPNGGKLRDEVISIGSGKMTLHSLDDGTTYTRAKALTCSKAMVS
jgi:Lipocalin-like domain